MVYVCRVQSAHGTCDFAFWTRRLLKGRRLVLWCTNLTLSERVFFVFGSLNLKANCFGKAFFIIIGLRPLEDVVRISGTYMFFVVTDRVVVKCAVSQKRRVHTQYIHKQKNTK